MTPTERFQRILDEGKCIGCGLCVSMFPEKLEIDVALTGYLRPSVRQRLSHRDTDAIFAVCPGVVHTGLPEDLVETNTIVDEVWGLYVRIEKAYAADPETRYEAATGGVLTGNSRGQIS